MLLCSFNVSSAIKDSIDKQVGINVNKIQQTHVYGFDKIMPLKIYIYIYMKSRPMCKEVAILCFHISSPECRTNNYHLLSLESVYFSYFD